jgi:hypothetical protein
MNLEDEVGRRDEGTAGHALRGRGVVVEVYREPARKPPA